MVVLSRWKWTLLVLLATTILLSLSITIKTSPSSSYAKKDTIEGFGVRRPSFSMKPLQGMIRSAMVGSPAVQAAIEKVEAERATAAASATTSGVPAEGDAEGKAIYQATLARERREAEQRAEVRDRKLASMRESGSTRGEKATTESTQEGEEEDEHVTYVDDVYRHEKTKVQISDNAEFSEEARFSENVRIGALNFEKPSESVDAVNIGNDDVNMIVDRPTTFADTVDVKTDRVVLHGNTVINGDLSIQGDLVVNTESGICLDEGNCLNIHDVQTLKTSEEYALKSNLLKSACISKEGVRKMDIDVDQFDNVPLDDDMVCIQKQHTTPLINKWITSIESVNDDNIIPLSAGAGEEDNTNTFVGCSKNDVQMVTKYEYNGRMYDDFERARSDAVRDLCDDEYESCKRDPISIPTVNRMTNLRVSPGCDFEDVTTQVGTSATVVCPNTSQCSRECQGAFFSGYCFLPDKIGLATNMPRNVEINVSGSGLFIEDDRDKNMKLDKSRKTFKVELVDASSRQYLIYLKNSRDYMSFAENSFIFSGTKNPVTIYWATQGIKRKGESELALIRNQNGWLSKRGDMDRFEITDRPKTIYNFKYN